ncbi:MAG TPA: site-specific integrase [Candidatus Angelobacter sp.]|nr:site-specific integrase [Candidatus Angelobacter sp.]
MLRRARYQQGSLTPEERKKGPAVWVYRWWERDISGKPVRRKLQIGSVEKYATASAAQAAADALRLTINNHSSRNTLNKTTINILWEHYCREELPLKEISTQDVYSQFAKNWILPRWGSLLLEEVKTVEVERWLRAAEIADGSKAKIKCVMSAVFSHAVRWEFCSHNPISSGIPVGSGGKRGPSVGVRVSAKRRRSPLVLSPEQVAAGLGHLEFRDQLLVFLEGALGARRGELGALRWMDCDFENLVFNVQHSYYWRRGGHLKATKTEASARLLPMHAALKQALLEWRSQGDYTRPEDFVFPSHRFKGRKPLDLAAVLKRQIKPAFAKVGITGVGWHTFRHTVGTMLAEMGEHQLTIRDYLRHANLHVTNKYLQATAETKRLAQDKLVGAILPSGLLSASKTNLVQ